MFVAVVLAVAGAIALFQHRQRQRRRDALALLALERGWRYELRDDAVAARMRPYFPVLDRGFGRRCTNVITATADADPVLMFDYEYKERRGSGRNRRTATYRWAFAATPLPEWLPTLRIDSENALTKLASMAGFRDIEVESDDFNRRFRVQAQDRTHAFDVLHPRMIEFLLQQPHDNWETCGGWLAVVRRGHWSPEDYGTTMVAVRRFQELVPDYVWRKHASEDSR